MPLARDLEQAVEAPRVVGPGVEPRLAVGDPDGLVRLVREPGADGLAWRERRDVDGRGGCVVAGPLGRLREAALDSLPVVLAAVLEADIGAAAGIGVAQHPALATDDPDRVEPVTVPVPGDGDVVTTRSDPAVGEHDVTRAARVLISQVPLPVADDADRVDTVPVPVTHQGDVGTAGCHAAVREGDVGVATAERVDEVPGPAPDHADGVDAVAVPVAHDREVVLTAAVVEGTVGGATGQAVRQVPGAVAVDTWCRHAVAVPVAEHGKVGAPAERPRGGRSTTALCLSQVPIGTAHHGRPVRLGSRCADRERRDQQEQQHDGRERRASYGPDQEVSKSRWQWEVSPWCRVATCGVVGTVVVRSHRSTDLRCHVEVVPRRRWSVPDQRTAAGGRERHGPQRASKATGWSRCSRTGRRASHGTQ